MSFASLRKNKSNALAGLQQKVQAAAAGDGGGSKDPRKFKLTYDKQTKIGSATIRFMPFGDGERLPWAEWIEFSFKGKGGNYWERSLKSLDEDDPIAELNHLQWERGEGGDKGPDRTAVRSRGRRLRYVSNIIVVNDPAHPENNGKNFLFEYGPAIHKKIVAAMVPEYEDQQPVQIFDMWKGATFRLRTKDKSGYLNYDDSTFDPPSVLHADEAILEQFYNGMIPLDEFDLPSNYKTFAELDTQMRKVLGAAYCASILGEEFTHGDSATQAAAGANPFPNEQARQTAAADPFANNKPAPAEAGGDPFANSKPAETAADPFANNGVVKTTAGVDPFANNAAVAGETSDDPFADLNM